MVEFTLPDVGEGLTEADILHWHVAVGDIVAVNDTLVEIETAKSAVELPSPVAGTVAALTAATGETVTVGTVIVRIEDTSAQAPLVLVGTGPSPAVARTHRLGSHRAGSGEQSPSGARTPTVRATPPVRLLAKRLGVDLATVRPASANGVVRRPDVEAAASRDATPEPAGTDDAGPETVTRTPVKGVRKVIAAAMTASAFTAPHVTEFLTVDATPTMELLARLRSDRAWAGVRLTPLVLVARALLLAVRRHPDINAWWDEATQEIVVPAYVHLGLAAATPRGLIVPNVRDAQDLDLRGLAHAVDELVTTARAGTTTAAAMTGGTITITNIGSLGVDTGTPILNPGEAAILALGSVRRLPWVVDGLVVARQVVQLALSFDHRVVDGELGSQVLSTVGRVLEDPGESFVLV